MVRLGADDVCTIAKIISQQHFSSRAAPSHLASPLNISVRGDHAMDIAWAPRGGGNGECGGDKGYVDLMGRCSGHSNTNP
jgi:hypothetical protein